MKVSTLKEEINGLVKSLADQLQNSEKGAAIPSESLSLLVSTSEKLYKKIIVLEFLTNNPINEFSSVNPQENSLTEQKQLEMELFSAPEKEEVIQAPLNEPVEIPADGPQYPYPDVRTAIGLNEKFMFINELFDTNSQEYNIAINQINAITSSQDFASYWISLKEIYNWDETNPSVEQFHGIVSKRFL